METTRYKVEGVNYESSIFASIPDQVIIVTITSDKAGSINFSAAMDRPSKVNISTKAHNELIMSGVTSDRDSVKGAVKFQAHVRVLTIGDYVLSSDTSLLVSNADTAVIYVSVASSFKNYDDISADAGAKADQYLQNALKKKYEEALRDNIAAYQKYFGRVT